MKSLDSFSPFGAPLSGGAPPFPTALAPTRSIDSRRHAS
jgi:hypothetical protein